MELGERIRSLRIIAGLSQSGLEKKSGIKRAYISRLETRDLKNPTFDMLKKLSNALEVDTAILVTDEPEALIAIVSAVAKKKNAQSLERSFEKTQAVVTKLYQLLEEAYEATKQEEHPAGN